VKTRSSAHVHTPYCDGKTPAGEMVRRALSLGFVSLGFSSHAPQPFDFSYSMAAENEAAYRKEILDLKAQYAGKMAIYLGLERDGFSNASTEGYDYYIASVHYFPMPEGFAAVDGPAEALQRYVEDWCGGDGLEMARRYYGQLKEYADERDPPIIGHFDLIRKNNAKLHLFDEESPAYQKIALDCLESIRKADPILEINTGAIARGYLTSPYPAPFLLSAWGEMGGRIMLNSDCHDAKYLDCGYGEAERLLKDLGYDRAWRLGKRELFETYDL